MRGLTAKAPSPAVHKGSLAPAGPGLVHRTANYANLSHKVYILPKDAGKVRVRIRSDAEDK